MDAQLNNTVKKNRNETSGQLVVWLVLLSILYLLRDIWAVAIPDIVFTGLCAVAFILLRPGAAMGVYIFTSALSVPDFEIRIVYLVVLLVKFWSTGQKINGSLLLAIMGMALLELIDMTLFSRRSVAGVIYTAVMRLSYFVLPLFWISEDISGEDYRKAFLCYIAGAILGGSVLLYMSVEAVGWEVLLEGVHLRLGSGVTKAYATNAAIRTGYNSNQLAIMNALVTVIALILSDQKRLSWWWTIPIVGYSAFVVFLTKSRTGVLLLLGIVVVYYWMLTVRRKKILSGVVFFLSVLLLFGIISYFFPYMVDDLLNRFHEEDITNGRDGLLKQYYAAWSENLWVLLFGYGIGSYTDVVRISNVPHDMISDILISWGLVGLVIICCVLFYLYRYNRRRVNNAYRFIAFLPAIVELAAAMSGQYLSIGYPHMRLCFWLLASRAFTETGEQA